MTFNDKKTQQIRLAFFSLLLVLFPAISWGDHNSCGTLKVGWVETPPYQMTRNDLSIYDTKNERPLPTGSDIDLAKRYLGALGCNLVYVKQPWPRLLRNMEHGKIDLLLGVPYIKSYTDFAVFSTPYREEDIQLFTLSDNPLSDDMKNLESILEQGFRLGVMGYYFYGDKFQKLRAEPRYQDHIHEFTFGKENYQMLLANRLDGYLMDKAAGMCKIEEIASAGVAVQSLDLGITFPVHMMFSKDSLSPALLQKLDRLIKRDTPRSGKSGNGDRLEDQTESATLVEQPPSSM
ncbi:substrate-binding periplasmic protein [Kiloniella sp. b19]|uniref:substrate-binding periplasmic protein n=1 Tax=Kiloniella sp. GXU_MW_B19 TaxID=3141326 RepID=UPI0031CEAE29